MVSQNDESLQDLRARVARLEKNAGRKAARIKRTVGAVIAGSEFDPRKEKGKAAKMRRRDLETYARRLSAFNSRSTQFEAGVRGAPLPRKGFQKLISVEQQARDAAEAKLKPLRNERLPGPGTETVGQRMDKIRTDHPTAMNMSYIPPIHKPFNIKDAQALDKLTKANQKRMSPAFAKAEHKRAQKEFLKMVEVFRSESLKKDVLALTYGQFDVLWNFTRFADATSLGYHHIKSKFTPKQEIPESVLQDQLSEAKSLIDWVRKFKI